jgi:hypothetical protein
MDSFPRVGRSREILSSLVRAESNIAVALSGYWRSLWSSPDLVDQSLKNCINIIHDDIVEIWNLNDKTGVWISSVISFPGC